MGVLPLEFPSGESVATLGLTGRETYHIEGIRVALAGSLRARVRAISDDGRERRFEAVLRVDTPQEAEYYRNGGILPYVLRQLAG
jgi:aconitate hydratase